MTGLLLAAVMIGFWYFALVVPATLTTVTLRSADLYSEHYPVARYAGEMLRRGEIPLWNPYQLNGIPFLAVPHSRLFYPPNLIYLLPQTGIAIEIDLVFHWLFAGVGLWLLVRAWGMSHLAGFAAATSFMLSRWLVDAIQWPGIIACAAWLPWTLLSIEGVLRRQRWAPIGLALALAMQLFNGATEFIVYNAYACALYSGIRLIDLGRGERTQDVFLRIGVLCAAVTAGVGLAAIQLLPTLELLTESGRLGGGTHLEFALGGPLTGHLPEAPFLMGALNAEGWSALGLLPLLGLVLFPKQQGLRSPWIFALLLVTYSSLLIFGGWFFELYFDTFLGQMFRRPTKFFYQYNLGLGIFAAVAMNRLLELRDNRSLLGSHPWEIGLAGIVTLAWGIWLLVVAHSVPWILGSIALLATFVFVRDPKQRTWVCLALCATQVVHLTLVPRNNSMRPFRQEHRFDSIENVFDSLRDQADLQRIYTSPMFIFDPATTPKQGLLRGAYMAVDYEPLTTGRQRDYYLRASMEPSVTAHFSGGYFVGENTRWGLLDNASVRFYLALANEPAFDFLRTLSTKPRKTGVRMHRQRGVDVFERTQALPRAYFVANALEIPNAEAILDRMSQPRFHSRNFVLLERERGSLTRSNRPPGSSHVEIEAPDSDTLRIDVWSDQPGYVVLTDTWYPGWEATVNGETVPIHRANFLFRAVEVQQGDSQIVFRYAPQSLRDGAQISGLFALALAVVAGYLAVQRRIERRSGTR